MQAAIAMSTSNVGSELGKRIGKFSSGAGDAAFYFFLWPKAWGFVDTFEFGGQLGFARFQRVGTITISNVEYWGLISSLALQETQHIPFKIQG